MSETATLYKQTHSSYLVKTDVDCTDCCVIELTTVETPVAQWTCGTAS